LENTQDSVKIGGLTLSGFKPVTNKLSCAWREPLWNRMDLLWFAHFGARFVMKCIGKSGYHLH
jgi:hypothetical protein